LALNYAIINRSGIFRFCLYNVAALRTIHKWESENNFLKFCGLLWANFLKNEEKMKFSELNISEEVIKATQDLGYDEMTEIQEKSIPVLIEGRDVIGKSNTGTGKTAAFGIPAIESITEENKDKVTVLILCPTRELSVQVCDELKKFSAYKRIVKALPIYGGASIEPQIKALKRGINIVIGTPGRVLDHIRRRTLKLDSLKTVILDEADEMLNMGFREDIEEVLSNTPEQRQVVLFSATMPPSIMAITNEYQNDPVTVKIESKNKTVDLIKQYYVNVAMGRKTDALHVLLLAKNPKSSMVFCNTKKMADELTTDLCKRGFRAAGLHGDLKQIQRTQVMQSFKSGFISILVATDVAARGIDVDDVETVFNYDIPQDFEYYIHRIGRTGRAGKEGTAYSFVCNRSQYFQLRDISDYTKAKIEETELPDKKEIFKSSADKFKQNIISSLSCENQEEQAEDISEYSEIVEEICSEAGITPERLAAQIIRNNIKPVIDNVPYINSTRPIRNQKSSYYGSKTVKLEIDLGRKQRIAPNYILGALVEATGLKGANFGKIDIFDTYSTIEVPESQSVFILESMQNETIKGIKFNAKISNRKSSNYSYDRRNKSGDGRKYGNYNDRNDRRSSDRKNRTFGKGLNNRKNRKSDYKSNKNTYGRRKG
jgi:ATP-dependent RNA helicase DeaD